MHQEREKTLNKSTQNSTLTRCECAERATFGYLYKQGVGMSTEVVTVNLQEAMLPNQRQRLVFCFPYQSRLLHHQRLPSEELELSQAVLGRWDGKSFKSRQDIEVSK